MKKLLMSLLLFSSFSVFSSNCSLAIDNLRELDFDYARLEQELYDQGVVVDDRSSNRFSLFTRVGEDGDSIVVYLRGKRSRSNQWFEIGLVDRSNGSYISVIKGKNGWYFPTNQKRRQHKAFKALAKKISKKLGC